MPMKDVKNLYQAVVRINAYLEEFDFVNPMNVGSSAKASGSGFFVTKDGCVMTCAHVVEGARKLTCNIPSEGQKEFKLEVLGICPHFDIAMLKIKNYKVKHTLALANEAFRNTAVNPGAETFAIGFPLGTETLKITKGILSGIQENFYQTDTPINPGNSGGPLMIGDYVIGINAAGILLADNIGYAVPTYRADLLGKELKVKKNLIHFPSTIFEYQKAPAQFNSCVNHGCSGGVIITSVPETSVFRKSKLKKGDVLCSINDIAIDNHGNMDKLWMNQKLNIANFMSTIKLNTRISVKFYRQGKQMSHAFNFRQSKSPIRKVYPVFEPESVEYLKFSGMIFMNLSTNHLQQSTLRNTETLKIMLDKRQHTEGKVILVNILSNSVANDWGVFKQGDIITTVNDSKVSSIDEMKKMIKKRLKCGSVSLENTRNQIIYIR